MKVRIKHKTIPNQPGIRTANGEFPAMGGNRHSNSKWKRVEAVWKAVFEQGETMDFQEFQRRYGGILQAVGFSSEYVKTNITPGSIKGHLEHAGLVEIYEEVDLYKDLFVA